MVCFEKHSLGHNYPNKKTVMSKNHKVYYRYYMFEAHKFIGRCDGVYKIEYNKEILYNVLMEDYFTMKVNNLICDTLDTSNIIAKIHNSPYSEAQKQKFIGMLNKEIQKREEILNKKKDRSIGYTYPQLNNF